MKLTGENINSGGFGDERGREIFGGRGLSWLARIGSARENLNPVDELRLLCCRIWKEELDPLPPLRWSSGRCFCAGCVGSVMRIRKNAAKILCPLSITSQSLALAAEGDAEAPATDRGVEMHVCELNQSPWDAMSFTPSPRSVALHLYEAAELEDETAGVEGASGRSLTEEVEEEAEAAAACEPRSLVPAELTLRRRVKIETMMEETEAEEKKKGRKVEANAKKPKGRKKVKRKKAASEEGEEGVGKPEADAAAPSPICKKTDGKGWHCKREAQHPHSLCEYHLIQVRSYYSNGGSAVASRGSRGGIDGEQKHEKKSSARRKIREKDGGGGRTGNPQTSDYYYYSGFGPWWGKRREQATGNVEEKVATPSDDGVPADLDLKEEETDDLGGLEDDDEVDVAGKRRGRKPIKARSLKSLL